MRKKAKKTKKRNAKKKMVSRGSERKLHAFLSAWQKHIDDEIRVHEKVLHGRTGLKKHVQETIRIHKKFIDKLKKL